jgi:hypothetical protein
MSSSACIKPDDDAANSVCSGYPNDAAGATEKRSDEGRCHNRPFIEMAYSHG